MTDKNWIADDLGMRWGYDQNRGKIYCIEAQEELQEKFQENPGDDTLVELEQNGYYADSFEEGVDLLIEYGYITRKENVTDKIRCEDCGYPKESNYISCAQCGAEGW